MTFSAIQTFFQSNFFPNTLWWRPTLDGSHWKSTFDWRQSSLEDRNWWKTCLLQRITFNRRQPYKKEKHQQENFNDRQLKLITAQFNFTPNTKSESQKRIGWKVWTGNFGLKILSMLENNQYVWFDHSGTSFKSVVCHFCKKKN